MKKATPILAVLTAMLMIGSWTARASTSWTTQATTPQAVTTHTQVLDHLRCPDGTKTCRMVIKADQGAAAATTAQIAATSNRVYRVSITYYDCLPLFGCLTYWVFTFSSDDWWNGSSAGAYWQDAGCQVYVPSWYCNPGRWGHYWNTGCHCSNDWENGNWGWNIFGIQFAGTIWLRMNTYPNGYHNAWGGCSGCG